MLLFSEVGWAPPDIMEVSDEFDRQYDPNEYEKKVSTIITHLDKRLQKDSPAEYDDWKSAVKYLKGKDHYVNVMIGQAGVRPPHDRLKLLGDGFGARRGVRCLVFYFARIQTGEIFPIAEGHGETDLCRMAGSDRPGDSAALITCLFSSSKSIDRTS